jgi:hypothetical protein
MNKMDANAKKGLLGGLFGGGENFFVSDVFAEVKKSVQEKLKYILISCMYCWNHM